MKIGRNILQNARRTFQAHARIDVLARERSQVVWRGAHPIKLGEHEIPNLDALAVIQLEINFAARPHTPSSPWLGALAARSFHLLPFAKWREGQANLFVPEVGRFVVVFVNGHAQAVGIDTEPLLAGQEFPRPGDGFSLEVVAEAKIAQHFEEGVVIGRPAHVIDIASAQAFLARSRARKIQLYFA